jgi:O-antigen ligase
MMQTKLVARFNQIRMRPPVTAPGTHRVLATVLGVLGLGVLAAALYLAPQPATLGLVLLGLGLPITILLWHRPEFGLLVLVFLASSFVPANIVDVRLPIGGGLDLRDLVLISMFGLVFLRELTHETLKVPWWPVGGVLLLFLIMAVFSAFYALVVEHVELNWALGDLRILSLYITFYITLWSIKRPEQLKTLLVGLFIIANLTTVIIYLQQFLGADNPLLKAMMMGRDWRVYQQAGAVRVVPAGQVLMHFMWLISLGVLVLGRPNRWLKVFYVMQLLFLGGGHLLTYMRAQWVALIIGLGLVFIVLVPTYKQRLDKAVAIACCIVLLFVGVIAGGSLSEVSATPFVAGITQRFGSLLTPTDTSGTQSLQWRSFEIEQALKAIRKQPLTGVGLGNRYRALSSYSSEASGSLTQGSIAVGQVSRFTRYVHNSYISIAVKMGIPGLIVFLWFCAAVLVKGFQMYRDMPDSDYKGMVLGILVGFAGLLVWCYFHAHLIKAESTATIGIMAALVGSIACTHGRGSASRLIQDLSLPAKG